ncbi:MAG: DUF5050 domain-containing protein [Syntrophomonas sp.]
MKRKSGIIIVLSLLLTMACMVVPPPALAWEEWPAASTDDPNHTWTVVFKQAMNMSTINNQSIYVSSDSSGTKRIDGITIKASDSTHAQVSPPTGGWSKDATLYLFISQKVLTNEGTPLKDAVRMTFSIKQIEYGNTVGNITNDGNVCKNGDWIYFTNTTDDYKLYKSHSDGSGWTKLCDDNASDINIVGDWIYYNGNNDLYKIKTDGSGRTKLSKDWPVYINVVGDWIYFSNFDKDGLYKIKTDGSALTMINDGSSYFVNVVGDWIYYQSKNDGYKLYKIRTDGSGKTKLNDERSACINVIDDWIYYCSVNKNYLYSGQLYRIRTDGTEKTKLSEEIVGYLNVSGDWIYYSNLGDKGKLYKMLKDGRNRTKVNSDDNTCLINVADDWVYYRTKIGCGYVPVYIINSDGSNRAVFN